MTTTVKGIKFTKVKHDVNGNPRYVVHFPEFINEQDKENAKELSENVTPFKFPVQHQFEIALLKAKTIGGRKYRGKEYGGRIVFQSYSLYELADHIKQVQKSNL